MTGAPGRPPSAVPVADLADPRLDPFRDLRDRERRRAAEADTFVAESPLVVRHLLRSGRRVRAVLVDPLRLEQLGDDLGSSPAPVYVAPRGVSV